MKRWPIIRHLRYFYHRYRVNQRYEIIMGSLPVDAHHDYLMLNMIWIGDL